MASLLCLDAVFIYNTPVFAFPDRYYWDKFDPYHVSEGIFAIANVLTFSRVSAMLPVNDVLGPMQISLGRMLNVSLVYSAVVIPVIPIQNGLKTSV